MTLTILDRTGSAYQVAAGTLVADGRPHLLVASLGGGQGAVSAAGGRDHGRVPARRGKGGPALALTLSGLPLAGWTGDAELGLPDSTCRAAARADDASPDRRRRSSSARASVARQVSPGSADIAADTGGQLVLLPRAAPVAAIPAIATRAFMDANNLAIGSVVPAFLDGA